MYSRYHNRSDTPIQVPENYGGCAFSETGGSAAGGAAAHRIDVAKPTPPTPAEDRTETDSGSTYDRATLTPPSPDSLACALPQRREAPREDPEAAQTVTHTHGQDAPDRSERPRRDLPAPLHTLFGKLGSAFPFSHGIGFDELLILGVILLLARNEDDSDLILWLLLLLFCG